MRTCRGYITGIGCVVSADWVFCFGDCVVGLSGWLLSGFEDEMKKAPQHFCYGASEDIMKVKGDWWP